jgi:phage terminase small subunit
MGEMTKAEVIEKLTKANPSARASDVAIYADAFMEYQAAQKNIDEHGSVVFHPKTGAPIDNPFCRVRDRASALILKMRAIKGDCVWPKI